MLCFFRFIEYLKYRLHAKSEFKIHAPFCYEFYTKAIKTHKKAKKHLSEIEKRKKILLHSNEKITVQDLGTGLAKKPSTRKISRIITGSSSSKKEMRTFFSMVQFLKPLNIVELGTSLGFTTMAMSKAQSNIEIITIEGCSETAAWAQKNFDNSGFPIKIIKGDIEKALPFVLEGLKTIGMVYFDANHTREATLNYFNICLPYINQQSVFIFDDIYWSPDMKAVWNEIYMHHEVSLSIDLFHFGLVFFNKKIAKQHFVLKY